MSDSSSSVLDYYGRCLRRALDQKVRKLRTLLTADEDITTELDRIVCRLMKLAIFTSKQRPDPPTSSWMQWKLFDLLTLTEKAIERRRRQYIENYQIRAIEYYTENKDDKNVIDILKKHDNIVQELVCKYQDVVTPPDLKLGEDCQEDGKSDFRLDGEINSVSSNCIEDFDYQCNYDSVQNLKEEILDYEDNCTLDDDNIKYEKISRDDIIVIDVVPSLDGVVKTLNNIESNNNELNEAITVLDPFTKSNKLSNKNDNIVNDKKLSVCELSKIVCEPKFNTVQKETSKTKIVKKVSGTIINSQHKMKRRTTKYYKRLHATLSKPIPNSLIKLCDVGHRENDMSVEEFYKYSSKDSDNNFENINKLTNIQYSGISDTENSLLIGIVTEYGEESIVLRRNVGIDPAVEYDVLDNEVLETVINITKEDDFLCKSNQDEDENREDTTSQTIFIYDINEPSTSKGIRNLSTDVQCGPDVSLTYAAISATTSSTLIPNILSKSLKIEDSSTHTHVIKKMSELGTCTDLTYSDQITTVHPTSTGIKIKDSEIDIYKVHKCLMTMNSEEFPFLSKYPHETMKSDSKLFKPAPNVNIDSSSGSCSCIFNLRKPPSRCDTFTKNTSNIEIQSITKENVSIDKPRISIGKKNLFFGGVHVHSFKEQVVCEDVVYQGKCQRLEASYMKKTQGVIMNRNNSIQRGNKNNRVEHKNSLSELNKLRVNKRKNISIKPVYKEVKASKAKKSINNSNTQIKSEHEIKTKKTAVKITSVRNVSLQKTRNAKSICHKNYVIDLNPVTQTKDLKNYRNKNYVPKYLRRNRQCLVSDGSRKINSKVTKDKERRENLENDKTAFFYSMKEEITKELLKFTENAKININYIVCRNEKQTKNSVSKKVPMSTPERAHDNSINLNRNHSPPSQNSSTCSSPNSVVTVRAAFPHTKTISCRRSSMSSDKSSSGFEVLENKSIKNKKYSKSNKNVEKTSNKSITISCNKENIPETSKNGILFKKHSPKSKISTFIGKTKSVFMAQATGNPTLRLTPELAIKNDLKKLIMKRDNQKERQLFSKPQSSIPSNSLKQTYDLDESKFDVRLSASSHNNISDIKLIEDEPLDVNYNIEENPVVLDSPNKSVHSSESLMFAIRQLIEQQINITDTNSHDSIDSGSETIIINRNDEHSYKSSSSPLSITTVIVNEDILLQTDIKSILVDETTTDQNESFLTDADGEPQIKETDALSNKSSDLSSVSTSKLSEYYLADNELDNTVLNINSVQDLYDRKDRNTINIDGLLAAQAFSGFSINTGSFVGDRLDSINFIDSETGSLILGSERQAVSEELFVSGRSSDTYESCLVEDDISVPNWLFNAINQQQSVEESEVEDDFYPLPIQIGEAEFDVNGNAMEPGMGVGAGAGDGRGIHSDQSQDSSGRGSSQSSSATSSRQNEAILTNLSAINADQPHYAYQAMNIPDDETGESHGSIEASTNNEVNHTMNINVQLASDGDADISSLDTDAIDSDD